MKALALALVASLAHAAETGPDAPLKAVAVKTAVLELEGRTFEAVGEGCYLPRATCEAKGKELASCRAVVQVLREEPATVPTGYVLTGVGGLALGALVVVVVLGATSHLK